MFKRILKLSRFLIYLLLKQYYIHILKLKNIDNKRSVNFIKTLILQKVVWPNNYQVVFNLQFDDVSAQDGTNHTYNYGGNPQVKWVQDFEELLKEFPFLKVNLFLVADPLYKRKGFYKANFKPGTWAINKSKALLLYLNKQQQLELSSHGLHHYQQEKSYFLKAREFEFKDKQACLQNIRAAQELFGQAGLSIKGFKPAGWGVGHNSDFGLLQALEEYQPEFACLSSPVSGLNLAENRVSNIYPQKLGKVLNIPQNISLNWSLELIREALDAIINRNGIITIQGHFIEQYNWMSDGIGLDSLHKLRWILTYLQNEYRDKIGYYYLSEIAGIWQSLLVKGS